MEPIDIPLPNGGYLRCYEGTDYQYGSALAILDENKEELLYWESSEWESEGEGESVIGAVFSAAIHPLQKLKELYR